VQIAHETPRAKYREIKNTYSVRLAGLSVENIQFVYLFFPGLSARKIFQRLGRKITYIILITGTKISGRVKQK
jgi:hypothetical protein